MWNSLIHIDNNKYNFKTLPSLLNKDNDIISKFPIYIYLYTNENKNVVVEIRDHGTGISKSDLIRIANIGNVFNDDRKKIISTMPEWLKPSGAFGLGLQSIFLVADKFEVITKTDDETTKQVFFENGSNDKGYIEVDDYKEYFELGTLLRIEVNAEKITQNDLYCSDYDYKTKDKGYLIIRKIYSEINNDSDIPLGYRRRMKLNDYLPVYLKLTYDKEIVKDGILYKSIFEENILEICNGKLNDDYKKTGDIDFEYYDCITESICKIDIDKLSNTNIIVYQNNNAYKYNQTLCFKNEFVKEDVFDRFSSRLKDSLYRHFDFSINILGKNADEILTIDRRDIKKEYEQQFYVLCDKAIENTLKKLLDIVIDNAQKNTLQSTIVKLYQITLFYNHRIDEFIKKYKSELGKYSFGNYLSASSDVNALEFDKTFTFEEINDGNIIFLVEEIPVNIISKNVINEIIEIDKRKCYWLKPDKVNNRTGHLMTILSHEITKAHICKINDKYYICIETKPFYPNNVKNTYEKDIYMTLDDFIYSIVTKSRIMYSSQKYDYISVINNVYFSRMQESVIELPLSLEQSNTLETIISDPHADKSMIDLFLQDIFKSELYLKNLKYISENNKKSTSEIDDAFKKFLKEILYYCIHNDYKVYVNYYLGKYKLIAKNTWARKNSDIYEKISDNRYTMF
jgi:hypothetical protein